MNFDEWQSGWRKNYDPAVFTDIHDGLNMSQISGNAQTLLYIDLMKRCLTNWIYREIEPHFSEKQFVTGDFDRLPAFNHTIIGFQRMDNLQDCVESIIADGVPGDLIETGVWRGGACILMRAILKAYDIRDRNVWLADSFQGLPAPDAQKYPADSGDMMHAIKGFAVSMEQVKNNFERYGVLDDQVKFLPGWFCDTLSSAPIEKISLMRLDGDMYGSTIEAMEHLYPKLSPGGYVIVDDYGCYAGCKKAIDDYRRMHGIEEEMRKIDWSGVYWRRSK